MLMEFEVEYFLGDAVNEVSNVLTALLFLLSTSFPPDRLTEYPFPVIISARLFFNESVIEAVPPSKAKDCVPFLATTSATGGGKLPDWTSSKGCFCLAARTEPASASAKVIPLDMKTFDAFMLSALTIFADTSYLFAPPMRVTAAFFFNVFSTLVLTLNGPPTIVTLLGIL